MKTVREFEWADEAMKKVTKEDREIQAQVRRLKQIEMRRKKMAKQEMGKEVKNEH